MITNLKNELKKIIKDSKDNLKDECLTAIKSVRHFALVKANDFSNKNLTEIADKIMFRKLEKLEINKGDLLRVTTRFIISGRRSKSDEIQALAFVPSKYIIPISCTLTKSTYQFRYFPNVNVWLTILYDESVYNIDFFDFINFVSVGYVANDNQSTE
jgi:hypothetical protein